MTRKQRHWKKHILAWQGSGLSQAAYCREHGLSVKTFGYHKRRFASDSKEQGVVPVSAVVMPLTSKASCVRPIKLFVRDSFTLEIEPEFCQQTLRRILEVIGA